MTHHHRTIGMRSGVRCRVCASAAPVARAADWSEAQTQAESLAEDAGFAIVALPHSAQVIAWLCPACARVMRETFGAKGAA